MNYYDSWLVRLLAVKAFWITWRVIVPLTVFHVPLGDFAVLFLVAELASGYWLALNFQVGARGLCVCCDTGLGVVRNGSTVWCAPLGTR